MSARQDPARTATVIALSVLTPIAAISQAFWLRGLLNAAAGGDRAAAFGYVVAIGAAVTVTLTLEWILDALRFRAAERLVVALDQALIENLTSMRTIPERDVVADAGLARRDRLVVSQFAGATSQVLRVCVGAALGITLLGAGGPALGALGLLAVLPGLASWEADRLLERERTEAGVNWEYSTTWLEIATRPPGAREARIFGLQAVIRQRCLRALHDGNIHQLRGLRRAAIVTFTGWLAFGAGGVSLLLVGLAGTMAVGDLAYVLTLFVTVAGHLAGGFRSGGWLHRILLRGGRYRQSAPDETRSGACFDSSVPSVVRDGIRFEDVRFSYGESERTVLGALDLRLPAGEVVAVVGENGAGKTTLVNLLCGFYQPTVGRITVDGTCLTDIDPRSWRTVIGGCLQPSGQFELCLRDAVGIGDPARAADAGAVDSAVTAGGAQSLVASLPDGAATRLGTSFSDAVNLSGGQWQRIASSRGMMRVEPLLVVWDEPTSSLDVYAEQELHDRIIADTARLRKQTGQIVVLISHRLASTRRADRIVVLSDGKVRENGTHAELLANNGTYAGMYRRQASIYT